jgi:hypothetical protein
VKHFGIHTDETLEQLRNLLNSFRYNYTLQYLPGWIAASLSLKCGQLRRAGEIWWKQTDVTMQTSNELWTRCWKEVLSLLDVEELVKEELLNRLSRPVFREGITKMPIIPYAKDVRGYLVSVGTKTIPSLPNVSINSTIAVPVVCVVEDQGGRTGPLNVNMVRQGEEFALEVQADDPRMFEWISEVARRTVERWDGDYKVRWGWYSFANTDDSIVRS